MKPDRRNESTPPASSGSVKKVRVSLVKSQIGSIPKHRATLRALGLNRIGKSREFTLLPPVQGMIRHVSHLVKVEDV